MQQKKEKQFTLDVPTPIGRFSYPHIARPRANELKNNALQFSIDLFVPYESDQGSLQVLFNAIHEVGQKKFGEQFSWMSACDDGVLARFGMTKPGLQQENALIKDFALSYEKRQAAARAMGKNPSAPTEEELAVLEWQKKCFVIRAWTGAKTMDDAPPRVIGPTKVDGSYVAWTREEIANIKGGDWGRLVVTISPYTTAKNFGLNAYLKIVQFSHEGDAFGQGGVTKALSLLDDLQVPMEAAPIAAPVAAIPAFLRS